LRRSEQETGENILESIEIQKLKHETWDTIFIPDLKGVSCRDRNAAMRPRVSFPAADPSIGAESQGPGGIRIADVSFAAVRAWQKWRRRSLRETSRQTLYW
jgi:hypothetical protein